MKGRRIVLVTVFAMSIVMLTACGSSQYVGVWQFASGVYKGNEVSTEQLEELTGGSVKLTLAKDGNALVEAGGKKAKSKWEENENGIVVYDWNDRGKSTTYTFKDDQLICTVGDIEMRLEKK